MDILAARKKAAERAQELKRKQASAPEVKQDAPADSLLPKETAPVSPAPQEQPALAADRSAEAVGEPPPAQEAAADQQPAEEAPVVEELEMLSFRLGSEEYAVMVSEVKEVLKKRELTPVPNAPAHILGVTALRGPILPVIDLCRRMGIPAADRDEKSRILVLNLNDEDAGIVVDRVTGVVRIHPESVRPVPDTLEGGGEFLKGIARKGDRMYILLDIEKALGAEGEA